MVLDQCHECGGVPRVDWKYLQSIGGTLHHAKDPDLETARIAPVVFGSAAEQRLIYLHFPLEFNVSDVPHVELEEQIPAETAPVHGGAAVSYTGCLGTFPQGLSFSIEIDYVGDVKMRLNKETVASYIYPSIGN